MCIVVALPILIVVRYLFLVAGAWIFWGVGLRNGVQLDAANAVFVAVLVGGVYALWRWGVMARWVAVAFSVLAAVSLLGPLAR